MHGKTGDGKTEYLNVLKEKGFDILDLEGAANHRGSFLDSISLGKSNTQKMFKIEIFEGLKT